MAGPDDPERLPDDMAAAIGHAVSAFGFLEEALKRAIFSLTRKQLGEDANERDLQAWLRRIEDIADDTLGTLTDKGILRRIQPAGSAARYEDRIDDNHHHLICRSCGRMVDVDCAVGATPCLTAADDSGYAIDEAEVIYWGRCPECMIAAADDGGPGPPVAINPRVTSNPVTNEHSEQREPATEEGRRA